MVLWSVLVSALALGGCASLSELYPECSHLLEESEPLSMCIEEAREYKRAETHNNYLLCQQAAAANGYVWVTYSRGPVKRDRKTGIPEATINMRSDMAANNCRLWSE
jgi:hypothetical protein